MTSCEIDGCDRPRVYRLWCRPHYLRARRNDGDPGPAKIGMRVSGTVAERFDARVKVVPGALGTPCHEWQGSRNPKGYGTFGAGNGSVVLAHRWSYARVHGTVPPRTPLDHLCRNPPCVNPDHLELVTWRENLHRSPGLTSATRTHCPSGHKYTPENTLYRNRKGHQARVCRTCNREQTRAAKRRFRERHGHWS